MTPLSFDYPVSITILYYQGLGEDMQDTLDMVTALEQALEEKGHRVNLFRVTRKNWRKSLRVPGEVVFNLVEDENWELYVKVGQALAQMGRAQVGHDMHNFKFATHKTWVKKKLARVGLSTPRFRIINRRSQIGRHILGLEYPLIVKPSREHAGIGISQDSVVIDQAEMEERVKYLFAHFPGEVVVEEYIEGREITVTVVGNGKHAVVLPFTEREFRGEFAHNWNVYTYEAKWVPESWEHWQTKLVCPARISRLLDLRLERLALAVFRAFGCRDIVRLDIRVDEAEKPYVVDLNVSPAIDHNPQEEVWRSAEAVGWTYPEFVETLVAITYKRMYGRLPDRTRTRQFLLAAPQI
mgnify:CR=1 FL=1